MGLEKHTTSFRLSSDTLEQLGQIQAAFSPFAEDRSSTLRMVVSLVHGLLFMPHSLQSAAQGLQCLLRSTLYCASRHAAWTED